MLHDREPTSERRTQILLVDISRAYFNAKVDEADPVYVELPPEIDAPLAAVHYYDDTCTEHDVRQKDGRTSAVAPLSTWDSHRAPRPRVSSRTARDESLYPYMGMILHLLDQKAPLIGLRNK